MSRLARLICAVLAFLLVGCAQAPKTPVPPNTPTPGRFIRVPTPTLSASRTPRPTITPTISVSSTLTVTLPIPTSTPVTVVELPDPSGYSWQVVVDGLDNPEGLVNAGDGLGRLFIVEQTGLIRIFIDGKLLPVPFLDLTQKVNCCGEKGLLGLTFHPKFAENGYFYVDYTEKVGSTIYTVVARYNVSADSPDQADPGSEIRILHIEQPFQNHKGGQLQFGPDGYLYVGMGDGGSEGDPLLNGQSLQTLLGKILRIDVDHGEPYAVPSDNPFVDGGGLWEIWAYGLRNPWRFSFDKLTGDLYIADVGQDAWEEIDYLPAGSPSGANFGWSYFEGSHPYRGSPPAGAEFVIPVAEYSHDQGNAVIGGYVYRGNDLPAWQGVYLYGDYGSGRVWGLLHLPDGTWLNNQLFDTGRNISSFGVDENGEIYLVDDSGSILMLK
ncbi:MAG: PQQ-dependent sugar dehydrogenase [Anaerolineae bacterium]|nr:PQQ-dependent sugar dehydrogenase [Anaerolineae bacterium]